MKRLIALFLLLAMAATMVTPMAFSEDDVAIVNVDLYSDSFDQSTYTTGFNNDFTELYLFKDGVKTWTFAKNSGAFSGADDAFATNLISNISSTGTLTTDALGGTIEAYYNFTPVTNGTVTIDFTMKSTADSKNIYFALTEDPVTSVLGKVSPSGSDAVENKSGYNDNSSKVVSMFKNHNKKYLLLLNTYVSSSDKSNYPSGNGATLTSGETYDIRFVLDVDTMKQSVYYKTTGAASYSTLKENVNWYANGASSYTMAENKVSGMMFNELTTAGLTLDNISVTHSYEYTAPKPIAYDPHINGTPIVGRPLTAMYTFAFEQEHQGQTSNIVWYRSDDPDGLVNPVEVQNTTVVDDDPTTKEYIVKSEDVGKYISCVITPACMFEGVEVTGDEVKGLNGKIARATATQPVGFISAPVNGDMYPIDDEIALTVDADSGDSQLAKVEYYIDGVKYSESTEAPFGSTYTTTAFGDHTVYAVITNVLGETSTTATVSFNVTESENTYDKLGVVHKRLPTEIECDWFSIGCEGLDRDMAVYNNYKEYLGQLGVTKARIQGGWAKCEKEAGVYDWAWLDEIVFDMVERGVTPWINTCYGNTIYEGGGGTTLSGGIPNSDEALKAWDAWVYAMVMRYKNVVHEWEIWNEADHGDSNTMSDYVTFFIRTSDVIKSADPSAKILGLASANTESKTLRSFMDKLKESGRLDTIDYVTVHGYNTNPDSNNNYTWTNTIKSYSTEEHPITVWCGETGVPDRKGGAGALGGFASSETIQAKWLTRRLLDARSKSVVISYFTLVDLMYEQNSNGSITQNVKGLLKINEDMTIKSVKQAYYSLQNLVSIFDNSIVLDSDFNCTATGSDRSIHMTGYKKAGTDKQIIATWFKDATPTNSTVTTPITFTVENGNFDNPVYVDVRTGDVYDIRKWDKSGDTYTFYYVPVYDSAILIADASTLQIDYDAQLVSKPVITDQSGLAIESLNDDVTSINASSLINGTIEDDVNLEMIIALYDNDDTLISVSSGDSVNIKGENIDKNISSFLTLDNDSRKAKKLKVFVWDINTYKPYLLKAEEIIFS